MRMHLRALVATALFLAITLGPSRVHAQVAGEGAPFSAYHIIQYATMTQFAPEPLIRKDDNGELLLVLREGATREELAARGIEVSETTILALRMMRLIEEDDDVLRTVIPLLDPDATAELRATTGAIAPELAAATRAEVREILGQLDSIGRQRNAYTLLFSYVVDGRVWDIFESRGQVAARSITAEKPFWSGEVWGVSPVREGFASGTNSVSDEGVALKVNWSDAAIPVMRGLMFDWDTQGKILESLREGSRMAPPSAREKLVEYGMADEGGRLVIPVVIERPGDPFYDAMLRLATSIADTTFEMLDVDTLVTRFGFRDRSQALVVAYHELMWDLMTEWEREGLVTPPVLLVDPSSASHADMGDVVFGVVTVPADAPPTPNQ